MDPETLLQLRWSSLLQYVTAEKSLFVISYFHMVLLRDFTGKTVWDNDLMDSWGRQWKYSSKAFFVLSLPLHIMIIVIY